MAFFILDIDIHSHRKCTHYITEAIENFKDNTSNYIKSLDIDDQVELVYNTLKNKDTSIKIYGYLQGIVKEDFILDFNHVKDMLQGDDLMIKKRGLNLSTTDRHYYTLEDAKNYEELNELIRTVFTERGSRTTKKQLLSSKEKEAWECECGKVNDIEVTYCTRCSQNIYGFHDRELQPEKAAAIIKNKISLVTESLEVQIHQQTKV